MIGRVYLATVVATSIIVEIVAFHLIAG